MTGLRLNWKQIMLNFSAASWAGRGGAERSGAGQAVRSRRLWCPESVVCRMLWVGGSVLRWGLEFTVRRAPQTVPSLPGWGPRAASHPCSSSSQNSRGSEPPG